MRTNSDDNDVEMGGIDWGVHAVEAPVDLVKRKTVLETRTAEEVAEELNAGPKRLKSVQFADLSIGSISDTPDKGLEDGSSDTAGELNTSETANEDEDDEEVLAMFSGDEEEEDKVPAKPTENQEKTRDREILRSFLKNRELHQAKEPKKIDPKLMEERQSVRWLANNTGAGEIVSSAREYQIELFERAKEDNIIAVLDTGSGKTLIAVLLLQHVIREELERRAEGHLKKISFFLVDSVALVFQQAAVLKCNLNQKVEQFCGDMGCDLWSKDHWRKHFEENMVIVVTAEVLFQCLHHSFVTMSEINLLIFDEAHHAKRNHPYARIIKDFYLEEKEDKDRPKIFGMTASPVDAKVDVQKAAMELEMLLHCKIATSSDASLLQHTKDKKMIEWVDEYDPLPPAFQTPLFAEIYDKIGYIPACRRPLVFAKKASSELGAWASDQVFANSFSPEECKKLKANIETKFHKWCQKEAIPISRLNKELADLDEAAEIIAKHDFKAPEMAPHSLSSKVRNLIMFLRTRYERTTDDKGIVFVKERYTARLLSDLLARPEIGTEHLRVGCLVGTAKGNGVDDATFRVQMLTLRRFRNGELNCLIATSVAEEGLDVPDCNMIVRFDLCQTVIQYIQSKGRARLSNSQYVHLMEKGNDAQSTLIFEVRSNAAKLKDFCKLLPEDRVLTGNSNNLDYYLANERATLRTYVEPSTKAKLTYPMSLSTLANFVASLENTSEGAVNPEYIMTRQGDKFRCEVILPENSPVQGCVGRPERSKQVAKCSAAFETCLLLRKGGYINEHLVSTCKRTGPAMRNARLAVGAKNNEEYDMKTKPNLWNPELGFKELYLTVIYLTEPEQMGRPSQPLGLITRGPVPQIPEFDLFFGKTERSPLYCTTISGALPFDSQEKLHDAMETFNTFTLRIFYDVFSKEYESDISKMPYFFVPVKENFESILDQGAITDEELLGLIEWDTLDFVKEHKQLGWEGQPDSFFEDRYLFDIYDGSRKLWTKKVTHELTPLDPPPPDTFVRHHRYNQSNIIEYSCSLFKKSRLLRKFSETQPVIEAERIPVRRNLLDDRSFHMDEADQILKCFVVPEPLAISALPTKVVAMAYCLPAVLHKLESYLIAMDACGILSLPLDPTLALESVTKDSQNTEEHGKEQIDFKRGMGKNYERLEFLGDCFLKMATSISLFTRYPDAKELDFHVKRMLMICNKNLTIVAEKLKLHEYIRTEGFTRRAWYPEGLNLLKGNTKLAKKTHVLGAKTIADVSEALIGASFLTPGEDHRWDTAVRAVAELVCSDDHTEQKWVEYHANYKKPKYQTATATASQLDLARQVESIDNYHFAHPRLLRSAFTHPTYPFLYERVPNYQRLEFLGDSLLDLVCVDYLFQLFPDKDPQWLTEHKMAMASNQFLGALCVELGFEKHLLHMGNIIPISIADYVSELSEAKELAIAEALRAGKTAADYSRDFWNHCKKPPKFLADMIESYIGAIFVDSGFDFSQVQRFFEEHIKWYFEDVGLYDTYANNHPVTALSKFFEQQMGCARYNITANQHADDGEGLPPQVTAAVMVHSQIVAAETRESSRYAKSAVAKTARDIFRGVAPEEFRRRWRCDCARKGVLDETTGEVDEKVVEEIVREELKEREKEKEGWELTSSGTDTEGSRKGSVPFS